jgi:hypothetical protein
MAARAVTRFDLENAKKELLDAKSKQQACRDAVAVAQENLRAINASILAAKDTIKAWLWQKRQNVMLVGPDITVRIQLPKHLKMAPRHDNAAQLASSNTMTNRKALQASPFGTWLSR